MKFGKDGIVKVKDFRELIKDLKDDEEICFMWESLKTGVGYNAAELEYNPPLSKEENEDWDDECCVGEYIPCAYIYVSG